jgi:hypothetical protein
MSFSPRSTVRSAWGAGGFYPERRLIPFPQLGRWPEPTCLTEGPAGSNSTPFGSSWSSANSSPEERRPGTVPIRVAWRPEGGIPRTLRLTLSRRTESNRSLSARPSRNSRWSHFGTHSGSSAASPPACFHTGFELRPRNRGEPPELLPGSHGCSVEGVNA